jgi:hypothetical protein
MDKLDNERFYAECSCGKRLDCATFEVFKAWYAEHEGHWYRIEIQDVHAAAAGSEKPKS